MCRQLFLRFVDEELTQTLDKGPNRGRQILTEYSKRKKNHTYYTTTLHLSNTIIAIACQRQVDGST